MEITKASFTVASYMQKVINPPVICDHVILEVKINSSFYTKSSRVRMFWNLNRLQVGLILMHACIKISLLFRHWREGNNAEQLCMHGLFLSMTAIIQVVFYVVEYNRFIFEFVLTSSLRLAKRFVATSDPHSKPGLKGTIAYAVCIGGTAMCLVVCPGLATISYHPIKSTAERILQCRPLSSCSRTFETVLDIGSGVAYGIVGIHATLLSFFILLGVIAFGEAAQLVSLRMLDREDDNHSASFREGLKLYRCLQILISEGSRGAAAYVQSLIICAVCVLACSGYSTVKLYQNGNVAMSSSTYHSMYSYFAQI